MEKDNGQEEKILFGQVRFMTFDALSVYMPRSNSKFVSFHMDCGWRQEWFSRMKLSQLKEFREVLDKAIRFMEERDVGQG